MRYVPLTVSLILITLALTSLWEAGDVLSNVLFAFMTRNSEHAPWIIFLMN